MPAFGDRSIRALSTAHPLLQELFQAVVKTYDCAVLEGHRNETAQEQAFAAGKSLLHWPYGKHNQLPSLAVDVVPWPVRWDDPKSFWHFAGYVQAMAHGLGIKIRWGGDWDGNPMTENRLEDLPHFELVGTARLKLV